MHACVGSQHIMHNKGIMHAASFANRSSFDLACQFIVRRHITANENHFDKSGTNQSRCYLRVDEERITVAVGVCCDDIEHLDTNSRVLVQTCHVGTVDDRIIVIKIRHGHRHGRCARTRRHTRVHRQDRQDVPTCTK